MNRPHYDLDQLQAWMQAVIAEPGGLVPGLRSEEARRALGADLDELELVVTRSRSLSASERLSIYCGAYYTRLVDCLRAEFPCLVHVLGDELFDAFARSYLQRYPSRSYTLNTLGGQFPTYLRETRPKADPASDARETWPDFLIDLAELERAFFEVYDGPGVEGECVATADDLLSVPWHRFHQLTFTPVVCLRLFSFHFAVGEYFTTHRRGELAEPGAPKPSWLALSRQDYCVRIWNLSALQYELLSRLVRGLSLQQSLDELVNFTGDDLGDLAAKARSWLCGWADDGFFGEVRLP